MHPRFRNAFGWLSGDVRMRLAKLSLIGAGAALMIFAATFLVLAANQNEPGPSSAGSLDDEGGPRTATPAVSRGHDQHDDGEQTFTSDEARALEQIHALQIVLWQQAYDQAQASAEPAPASPPASEPEPSVVSQPSQPAPPSAPQAPPPPPPPPPAPPPPPPAGCPTAGMAGYGLALFNAINSERTSRGLPALQADPCVVYVAQRRSNDMAANNYFSHTSPSGESAFTLLDAYGVPHGWAGENLARNNYPDDQTVAIAIRDLMASQGHRDNILSTNYNALGVGFAVSGDGMKYFTMVFIGPP
jgi:uncharacterized protein YkwD